MLNKKNFVCKVSLKPASRLSNDNIFSLSKKKCQVSFAFHVVVKELCVSVEAAEMWVTIRIWASSALIFWGIGSLFLQ